MIDQKKKEEDMLFLEKQYSSLQEEVNDKKQVIQALRKKYKAALSDNQDLEREKVVDKSDLLENLAFQAREIKLLNGVILMLLTSEELAAVKSASNFNEDT